MASRFLHKFKERFVSGEVSLNVSRHRAPTTGKGIIWSLPLEGGIENKLTSGIGNHLWPHSSLLFSWRSLGIVTVIESI
jgi:hypothetical protein